MKKRILSMLLVVCMLMSMLPTAVFAANYAQDVSTYDELVAALAEPDTKQINLTANITADSSILVNRTEPVVIYGDSHTITAGSSLGGSCFLVQGGASVEMQDLTIEYGIYGVEVEDSQLTLTNTTVGAGVSVNAVNANASIQTTAANVGTCILLTSANGCNTSAVISSGSTITDIAKSANSEGTDSVTITEGSTVGSVSGDVVEVINGSTVNGDVVGKTSVRTTDGVTITGNVLGGAITVEGGTISGNVTGDSVQVTGGTIGGKITPAYQAIYAKGENVEVTDLGGSYAQGQTVTFTATADGGYTLDADSVKAQTDGGTDVTVTDNKDGSFSFTMPAENVSVTVTATALPGTHTVTFMNGNNVAGTITVTDGDTITKANAPTLTPDAGYVFEGWFSGVGATGEQLGEAPVTVNADLVYYASFYSDNYTVHRNDTDIIEVTEVNGQPAGPTVTS